MKARFDRIKALLVHPKSANDKDGQRKQHEEG